MTQPGKPTAARYRLIDLQLGGKFDEWVAARRPAMSWEEVADALCEETGERLNRETLRQWFGGRLVTETRLA